MESKPFNIRQLVKRERHAEIFDWLARITGKTHEQLAGEMLLASIMKEASVYREAQGGGGGSSKSLEALAKRLG